MQKILQKSEKVTCSGRIYHEAWSPPTSPDAIILFGGIGTDAAQTAEVIFSYVTGNKH